MDLNRVMDADRDGEKQLEEDKIRRMNHDQRGEIKKIKMEGMEERAKEEWMKRVERKK